MHNVDVVRRITGGGAVYHDSQAEITYSVITAKKSLRSSDLTGIYTRIYAGIVEAMSRLGITVDFNRGNLKTCPNLTVQGRKISGSAQSHKKGVILQHGTLLLDCDLRRMFTFLRVPWAKTNWEVISCAEQRITSLKAVLRQEVTNEEVIEALTEGFQHTLGKLCKSHLTCSELKLADKLFQMKYSKAQWNFSGTHEAIN
jgi:lipoate-protein ligase A